mmetsp:Transcript_25400/g.53655  ORF Transcript_25400/g.53655 Transcript_25400/m.53655 type:complete len:284 (+) Transcript_25400:214-1065(+)
MGNIMHIGNSSCSSNSSIIPNLQLLRTCIPNTNHRCPRDGNKCTIRTPIVFITLIMNDRLLRGIDLCLLLFLPFLHQRFLNKQQQQQRQPINNPSAYVIVSNLQSGGNIGNIVRSASIFGCEECIVVGQKRYRMTGDHGSRLDLPQRHIWTHADVKEYLGEKRVRIYGIEIMENASPIMQYDRETGVVTFPFESECEGWSGSAFIFGNEGQGLSTKQREICDEFLFIPQNRGGRSREDSVVGSREKVGSASMNVACAAAVVLQAYSMWAGYSEARFEGEKFLT